MRFYRFLLRLYPTSFRNEYGGEMGRIFADRRRDARGLGVAALWTRTVGEVAWNAALVHAGILAQDLRYTLRVLRRTPGFALTAILIVSLGIGATTAAFSVTDFVLIRPLPFPDSGRLVTLWESTPGYTQMELSPPNYRDWKAGAKSFDSVGAYVNRASTMTLGTEVERVTGTSVSADLFPTLGVAPIVGRGFSKEDDDAGAPATMILAYGFWHARFGADASVVGRTITLDNEPFTVIGVMGPRVNFPSNETCFWTTTRYGPDAYAVSERTNNYLSAVGRLRHGVTLDQARAEARAVAKDWQARFPKENKDSDASLFLLADEVSDRSRLLLWALLGAATCVLLIACANLANLLLARALGRQRELAIRTAMGAGRERLVRQLLTESLLVAITGGVIGVGLAMLAVPLLAQLVPTTLPLAAAPAVDVRVLTFAFALTILTGVGFGLAPVMRASRGGDLAGLREGPRAGGGNKERLRSALVVAEITASVALLVSAGLLIRALLTVRGIDPGFNPTGVLTLRVDLPMPKYRTVAARDDFYTRVVDSVGGLPGVSSAGWISFLPMSSFRGGMWPVTVPFEAASETRSQNNVAAIRFTTPGYFKAMGIPIVRGRDIGDGDNRDRQFVAVVSQSFVRRYWPNQDPIGQRFTFASAEREVVGVAGDVRFRGLERVSEPQVYLSPKQVNDGAILFYMPRALAVRTSGSPAALAGAVREAVKRAEPQTPIYELQTLSEMVDAETASRAVQARVLGVFALIAFGLAAVGIHGLLSFAVSQRVTEIGVRVALGAQSRDILSMVMWQGLALAAVGIVMGVVLACAAGRGMEAILAGVPPTDLPTIAGAIGVSLVMTVVGTLLPTLRALRVDPIRALRAE